MQILLANAKLMHPADTAGLNDKADGMTMSKPLFQSVANKLAAELAQMDIDELARQFKCSRAIAAESWKRYQNFFSSDKIPAILAYNGQAYKHLKADTLNDAALTFGQKHLWITCFLYGLLRPMDAITPYRMEHCVTLEATQNRPVNQFWGNSNLSTGSETNLPSLTDVLISSIKADDGILIHLSTEEYEHLFDWKRIKKEVTVIQPLFYVRKPNVELKMQAIWAKSCRGAMVRYILQNQITSVEELKAFSHAGFEFNPNIGEVAFPHFVKEKEL